MLLGTRVQFPPPPFDSLRSLMAGRLSPIRVRNDDSEGNCESNALSKRSASKGSPRCCARTWQASSHPQTLNTGLTFLDQAPSIRVC
jgi:hypothetical protein